MTSLFMTTGGAGFLGTGYISIGLGKIVELIYNFFSLIGGGSANIGLVIIVFTVFIYACMLPLTYRQQKFTFMTRRIQPEITALQKKYKGRRDQDAMIAMQEEQKALYEKYGISPSGSCIQMFIQLPILWALYGVFRNIPAYVGGVKDIFFNLTTAISAQPDAAIRMQDFFEKVSINQVQVNFLQEGLTNEAFKDYIIDVAYKLSDSGWTTFQNCFPNIKYTIQATKEALLDVNSFGVLNISDTPINVITTGASAALVVAAIMIPVFSFFSQVVSVRTMSMGLNNSADQTANTMRMMNRIMPFISLIFVFNVPIGLGLYWIAGAFFRALFQFVFNRRFSKIDMDSVIESNKEKAELKKKKRMQKAAKNASISAGARTNTRKTATDRAKIDASKIGKDSGSKSESAYRKGSMASKANLVKDYNKKKNRK